MERAYVHPMQGSKTASHISSIALELPHESNPSYWLKGMYMATKSILLIEHEASLREVLGACLQELGGWDVMFSSSIREGIQLCDRRKPQLILMDTSTPEVDALIFIEQLKTVSHDQAIPILLISSRASWLTPQQLHQMGFAGAISKPFDPSSLPTQIGNLLSRDDFKPQD